MTHNELIIDLLKYDEFDYKIDELGNYSFNIASKDTREYDCWFEPMGMNYYLTDMNILHRLAVKVVRKLFTLNVDNDDYTKDMDIREVKSWIDMSMYNYPNDKGEHIQLAEALVNAIRYISANKAG